MRDSELILYRSFKHGEILKTMSMLDESRKQNLPAEPLRAQYYEMIHKLIELAGSHGYRGNLWHMYLTYLLANNENAFSYDCEMRGRVEGSINEVANHDFAIFKEMFELDLSQIDGYCQAECLQSLTDYKECAVGSKQFNKRIRDRVFDLGVQLAEAGSAVEFGDLVCTFYKEFGVGKFGLHKAFRVEHMTREVVEEKDGNNSFANSEVYIKPILNIPHVQLEDLIGYELQKKQLMDNTEAFLNGRPANNCLLFGDAGTGKSSSIKGILNRYYDRGLRIIEVYKHQFQDLNEVIAQIKSRNYKFIIYMDDLSFEDFETEYKYLKAVIEGGLEKRPDNVLIYATSNRRHLVREKFSDKDERDDDLHTRDTVSEKLSLSYRFGVSIFFPSPDKKEYGNIVKELALKAGIEMEEEKLLLEANRWELMHGGFSGRCASQFIDYLKGVNEWQ